MSSRDILIFVTQTVEKLHLTSRNSKLSTYVANNRYCRYHVTNAAICDKTTVTVLSEVQSKSLFGHIARRSRSASTPSTVPADWVLMGGDPRSQLVKSSLLSKKILDHLLPPSTYWHNHVIQLWPSGVIQQLSTLWWWRWWFMEKCSNICRFCQIQWHVRTPWKFDSEDNIIVVKYVIILPPPPHCNLCL